MTNLRAIIIDDEPDSIEVVKTLLAEFHQSITVVGECASADEAITTIKQLNPDLLFLDVEMPGKSGFEVLKAFDNPPFQVIFISGYDQYALRAIKFSAVDYILKPIDLDELVVAVEKVIENRGSKDKRLQYLGQNHGQSKPGKVIISSKQGFETLDLNQIISIESRPGNYAVFHLSDSRETLATKPLNYYEDLFSESDFFRIHRSYVINLLRVAKFNSSTSMVEMSDGSTLEVAHRRKQAFSQTIKERFPI